MDFNLAVMSTFSDVSAVHGLNNKRSA